MWWRAGKTGAWNGAGTVPNKPHDHEDHRPPDRSAPPSPLHHPGPGTAAERRLQRQQRARSGRRRLDRPRRLPARRRSAPGWAVVPAHRRPPGGARPELQLLPCRGEWPAEQHAERLPLYRPQPARARAGGPVPAGPGRGPRAERVRRRRPVAALRAEHRTEQRRAGRGDARCATVPRCRAGRHPRFRVPGRRV